MEIELDVDDSYPSTAKRKRIVGKLAAGHGPDDLPPGPADARQSSHWAEADVAALRGQGLKHFGKDLSEALSRPDQRRDLDAIGLLGHRRGRACIASHHHSGEQADRLVHGFLLVIACR